MTMVNFTGAYWNGQTLAAPQDPWDSTACRAPQAGFEFKPNDDVFINIEAGSMRLERTSQNVRSLVIRNTTCGGRRAKGGISSLLISFSALVEVSTFQIAVNGSDNNPADPAQPFEAYLVVPRRVFRLNTGNSVVNVTSAMLGTGGRIGPIRYARLQSNRPGHWVKTFSYEIGARLGKGDVFPPRLP